MAWAQIGRDERGTKIIHVDPRFTRTSAIADLYAPIRAGTDVAFFGGLINYILENKLYHEDYVKLHTNAPFIVGPDFTFDDGMFSGYDEATRTYDPTTWDYDRLPPVVPTSAAPPGGQPPGSSGGASALGRRPARRRAARRPRWPARRLPQPVAYAKTDPTLQDPRSVFQLMKAHYSRYTPEKVSEITGMPVEKFHEDRRAGSARPARPTRSATSSTRWVSPTTPPACRSSGRWAWSRCCSGNMGRPGGGVNAERGHANIQGNTDNAISWEIFPGYLAVPKPGMNTMADYIAKVPSKASSPTAVNYFGTNYKKFLVSLLKSWYGDAAQPDNDFRYSWLPEAGQELVVADHPRRGPLRQPRRPLRRRHVGREHRARLEPDERVARAT